MSQQHSANHSRRNSDSDHSQADQLSSSRVERVLSHNRLDRSSASQAASHSRISSADYIITVSPGARTPPRRQSGFNPQQPGDTDIETGPSPQQSRRSSSTSVGRLQALLQSHTNTQPAAVSDLTQPLLQVEEPDQQDPKQQQEPLPSTSAPYDPFPATTAARAAASEVARARALAAHRPHADRAGGAAVLARSVSSASAGAVAGTSGDKATEAARFQRQLAFASGLSWVVNIVLLVAKLYAYWLSQSKAVLASAADSAVDLVSQVVISYADWRVRREDPRFPVGQARLEAIGVLACACIMSVASFEVIQESVSAVVATYTTGQRPQLELGLVLYLVLGSATLLKLVCWAVCAALQNRSDSMLALAEDHLNDIMSNSCAIFTAVAAGLVPNGWWIDPAGAIAISVYIVTRWLAIAKQQVDKIIGRGAPVEFILQLESLANSHHQDMGLDCMRAYHFGARYIVEMEVVLPAEMTVKESHDISLELQHKVEQLEEVERAFVHVDYTKRDGLEHKVERELAIAQALSTSSSGRLTPGLEGAGGSGAFAAKA